MNEVIFCGGYSLFALQVGFRLFSIYIWKDLKRKMCPANSTYYPEQLVSCCLCLNVKTLKKYASVCLQAL